MKTGRNGHVDRPGADEKNPAWEAGVGWFFLGDNCRATNWRGAQEKREKH